jgi:hypothetical protein
VTWQNSRKPGEKVQTSGIYEVVKEGDGGSGFEVTCVEGEHFPPTRSGKVRTTSWFTARRMRRQRGISRHQDGTVTRRTERLVERRRARRATGRAAAIVGKETYMRRAPGTRSILPALVLLLAGCAAGGRPYAGPHLSPTECRDLAALRTNAPPTMAQHHNELAALRKAGYNPSPWYDDPYYPDDLQAAQRLVDYWFQTECQQPQPG